MGVVGRVITREANVPRLCQPAGHPPSVPPTGRSGRPGRVVRGLPAIVAAGLLLAACSSSGSHSSPTTVPGNPDTSSVSTTSVPNDVALRKDVSLRNCAAVAGGWSASGTVVSPGADRTYTITVFFVTVPGDTVEGSGVAKVSVPAGQTKDWKVVGEFKPTSDMQCVLRGVG